MTLMTLVEPGMAGTFPAGFLLILREALGGGEQSGQ